MPRHRPGADDPSSLFSMSIHAVPRLPPGLTARPRLTARLDAPAALVVLRAPSGFGKTTAMIQWATTTDRVGVWLRVSEGMSEPAAFVHELSAQLAGAGLLDEDDPLDTAAGSPTIPGEPWGLLNRRLRRIDDPLTLVLDQAEHLDDDTVAGILGILREQPALSLRVASCEADRFADGGRALALGTDVLGAADLALTPDEAAAVLGAPASDEVLAHVLRSGGSPALARIARVSGRRVAHDGRDAVEAAVTSLPRLPSSSWDDRFLSFLGRISLSELVDPPLARELTGDPEPGVLLDRAEAEGLGYWTSPPNREGALFVPSPLFRRVLAASTRRRLPGRVTRELEARIARWNLAAGRAFPALGAAVRSRDGNLMTDVVRVHWYDLLRSAREVRKLFRRVPPLALRAQPLPCMLLAALWDGHGARRLRARLYLALAAYGAKDRALLGTLAGAAATAAAPAAGSARPRGRAVRTSPPGSDTVPPRGAVPR